MIRPGAMVVKKNNHYAEQMKTLTDRQLFRIANYVPDNAEMYDDASIASIYGQIRAAQKRQRRLSGLKI